MAKQKQTIDALRLLFRQRFGTAGFRFIKIAGSAYQEDGLPDLLIKTYNGFLFWFEIKRDWEDKPTPLQIYNINDLRIRHKLLTGFCILNKKKELEFKRHWEDKAIDLGQFIKEG